MCGTQNRYGNFGNERSPAIAGIRTPNCPFGVTIPTPLLRHSNPESSIRSHYTYSSTPALELRIVHSESLYLLLYPGIRTPNRPFGVTIPTPLRRHSNPESSIRSHYIYPYTPALELRIVHSESLYLLLYAGIRTPNRPFGVTIPTPLPRH